MLTGIVRARGPRQARACGAPLRGLRSLTGSAVRTKAWHRLNGAPCAGPEPKPENRPRKRGSLNQLQGWDHGCERWEKDRKKPADHGLGLVPRLRIWVWERNLGLGRSNWGFRHDGTLRLSGTAACGVEQSERTIGK